MKHAKQCVDRQLTLRKINLITSTTLACLLGFAALVAAGTSFAQTAPAAPAAPASAPAAQPPAPTSAATTATQKSEEMKGKGMGMGMKKGQGPHEGGGPQAGAGPTMGAACKADLEKLCAGVDPGEGRLIKCLKEKESQVSAECKASWDKMKDERKDRRQEMRVACGGDAEKHCPGMKPGDGQLMKCMKEKEAQLSAGCKAAMSEMGPKRR
jgi:hypothetical protein